MQFLSQVNDCQLLKKLVNHVISLLISQLIRMFSEIRIRVKCVSLLLIKFCRSQIAVF
jgi:hypothetical protein